MTTSAVLAQPDLGRPGVAPAPPERGVEPLLLLLGLIALSCVLTWTLPAGRYERLRDQATGRTVVVPGSYASVPRTPVGPWAGLRGVSRGLVDAAPVVFYVLLSGAALTVVERTGALERVIDRVSVLLVDYPVVIVPLISMLFMIGGATYGMYEEIIAFLPILCALAYRMRFDALTAFAMSVGTASVASSFSPVETFKLSIAQPLAEVPMFSGFAFRTIVFLPVMLFWIGFVSWHASRVRRGALAAEWAGAHRAVTTHEPAAMRATDIVILVILNGTMGLMVVGAATLGWGLSDFSTAMLAMGCVAGLVGGLGPAGTARGFAEGFRRMAYAATLVGVARAILIVLQDGQVLDTIAFAAFAPLSHVRREISGAAMLLAQSALAVPMPSDSARAMVTMPIVVPLSDLLQVPRQVTVLAYQYATLVSSFITPTAGSFLAMLAVAQVPLGRWLRFVLPAYLVMLAVSLLATALAVWLRV